MTAQVLKVFINSILIYLISGHSFPHSPCELVESNGRFFSLEQATIKDISQILLIYKNITPNDSSKIVVYPEEVRRKKIMETIRKKLVFIVRDVENNKIVSFLKAYLLDNPFELKKTLACEIRALGYDPLFTGYYSIPTNNTFDYTEQLEFSPGFIIEPHSNDLQSPRCLRSRNNYSFNPEKQTYLYYGNGYTIPAERGHGINTKLQKFALDFVKPQVLQHIEKNKSTALFYLYGQVNANMGIKNSIRIFANYITSIRSKLKKQHTPETRIHSFCYRAYKPIFQLNPKGELIQLPDHDPAVQQGKGIGNILCHYFEEPKPSAAGSHYQQEINPFNFNFSAQTTPS